MTRVVISVGGSVLVPTLDTHRLVEWADALKILAKAGHQIFAVVGGGGEARRYISVCRGIGLDEASSDEFGILITRINAKLLIAALGEYAYPCVAESYLDAKKFALTRRIVIMGGVTPGQTTDAVAACLAEETCSSMMINMTAIDGIYSADPRKDPEAVKYGTLGTQGLIDLIVREKLCAGSNMVFDLVAAKIIERSGIPLIVIDGRDPSLVCRVLLGGEFAGTIVGDKIVTLPI
ncbi:MAG: UMP kinase [Methanocalculaceae archaeon]|jgi:uridylate kinase|nr:UMP kinase [Methanocalculaceae archaeon]